MNKLLSILVLFAFVSATVSPACKFISGQLAEICGADGTVIEMPIPEELLAFLPEQPPEDNEHQSASDDCMFCFAQVHFDANSVSVSNVVLYDFDRVQFEALNIESALRQAKSHQPRGPPVYA